MNEVMLTAVVALKQASKVAASTPPKLACYRHDENETTREFSAFPN